MWKYEINRHFELFLWSWSFFVKNIHIAISIKIVLAGTPLRKQLYEVYLNFVNTWHSILPYHYFNHNWWPAYPLFFPSFLSLPSQQKSTSYQLPSSAMDFLSTIKDKQPKLSEPIYTVQLLPILCNCCNPTIM